ncbi:MAG: DUF1761 domain-containing protein [Acidobacteriota bacterium]
MHFPQVNYLAVLVAAIVNFILGGLWYSKALFATKWIALMGKSEEELKAKAAPMPVLFIQAFICGLVVAWVLATVLNHFAPVTPLRGALVGALCWLGFTAATTYATAIFSSTPKGLWLINAGYDLVSFVLMGAILGAWR